MMRPRLSHVILVAAALCAAASGAAAGGPAEPPAPAGFQSGKPAAADARADKPPAPSGSPAARLPVPPVPPPAATGRPTDKTEAADAAARKAEALASTRRALAAPVAGLEFQKTPLRDALAHLAEAGRFSLVFDPALKEAGIDLAGRPVTARLAGITYDDALYLLLPKECGYRAEAGYVLITTLEKSWVPLTALVYKPQLKQADPPPLVVVGAGSAGAGQAAAQDLRASYRGPHPTEWSVAAGQSGARVSGGGQTFIAATPPDPVRDAGPAEIIAMIKRLVRHRDDRRIAPWDDEGGPAAIHFGAGRLVITQTEHGHRAVARLLPQAQ